MRQNRLITGVNFLDELPPKLRQGVLLMKEKTASQATSEDAMTLARYEGLLPQTNAFNDFVEKAIA